MTKHHLIFLSFCGFLGLVLYAADTGIGDRYWGWLKAVPMGDKVGHLGFMSTLCFLANRALGGRRTWFLGRPILLATGLVAIFVVAEEFTQIWLPHRHFDMLDLMADAIGITCGDWLARALVVT